LALIWGESVCIAQERIYVTQTSPAQIRSFTFDGTALTEQDTHPSPSRTTLPAGTDPLDLFSTGRFLMGVSGSGPINLLTIDPITGTELSRVSCCSPSGAGKLAIPTADGQYIHYFGNDGVASTLQVLDARIGSPGFLTVLPSPGAITLPFPAGTAVTKAVLDTVNQRLIVAVDQAASPRVQFLSIDVSNPTAPVLGPVTVAESPDRGAPNFDGNVTSLRIVESNGERFLFAARRRLQVYRIEANGSLTYLQSIDSVSAAAGNRGRTVRDLVVLGTRAYAVTDVQPIDQGVEELVVLDLSRPGATFSGAVLSSRLLGTTSNGDVDMIAGTADGEHLIVLDRGDSAADLGGTLRVYNRAAVDSGAAGLVTSRAIDLDTTQVGAARGLLLHAPITQAADGPAVTSVTVPGSVGNVLVNDQARDLVIQGANLGSTVNVFVGLVRATVLSATATTVVARVPPLALAGLEPVVVAGATGTASGSVRVSNAPGRQAPYLVYSIAVGTNQISQINAASQSEVTAFYRTGRGPFDPVLTADGRLLVSGEFQGNRLLVHSLIEDPARSWHRFDVVAAPVVGGATQAYAVHPARPRAYVASLTGLTIATIDLDPASPTFGTEVAPRISTLSPGESANQSNGGGVRGMTVTPDGRFLLAGRSGDPHVIAINVEDDAHEVTLVSLTGVPAGRSDGLGMHPTLARLYFASAADGRVRVYDTSALPALTEVGQVPIPGTGTDVRKIVVSPDGAFAYVSSRGREAIDVIDTASDTLVATIPTGPFSSGLSVSPDSGFLFVGVGGTDAVLTIDLRPTVDGAANPSFRTVIAASNGGVGASAATVDRGVPTPAGGSQTIQPLPGTTVTFGQIDQAGHTTLTVTQATSQIVPGDYAIVGTPLFYELRTTAAFSGPITVCLPYSGVPEPEESSLRLLHEERGALRDITTSVDTTNNRVCGVTTSLSQFMVARHVNVSSPPDIPRYLWASVSGPNVELRWTPPAAGGVPTGYIVEAGFGTGSFPIRLATGSPDARFATTNVPPGTYAVRVRAANAQGTSDPSETVSFSVGSAVALPGAPMNLIAGATGSTVSLAWHPPASGGAVQGYRLSVGSQPGRDDIITLGLPGTSTTFGANAVPAGRYYIRVRALNAGGMSASSNEALLVVGAPACVVAPAPPVLTSTVTGSSIALSWTMPAGAVSGFRLEAGSAPGLSNAAVVSFPASQTSLGTTAPRGTYYVRVRALSPCGPGNASPEVVVQVP
jgi:hypothetical protein